MTSLTTGSCAHLLRHIEFWGSEVTEKFNDGLCKAALLLTSVLVAPSIAWADHNTAIDGNNGTLPLPTGLYVTPLKLTNSVQQPLNPGLPAYPNFVAGMAVRSQLSPDGSTLAIITAGQNSLDDATGITDVANSTQYIFLYNVAGGNKTSPVLAQIIKQTNAWVGLVFSPDGNTLYATGGLDDVVYAYSKGATGFTLSSTIALGHKNTGVGLFVEPNAGGLGISSDGLRLVVANNYNDSISVIDTAAKTVLFEHDLRPFQSYNEGTDGAPGGTYPYTVIITGTVAANNLKAFVSSDRDREVDVVSIGAAPGQLAARIKLAGNGQSMTISADQSRLYVAQDNTDQVAIINTATNAIVGSIDARAPASYALTQTGAGTAAVTLSNNTLYAVNSGANTIAVIPLTGANANTVTGLIPTAYEPHDVTFSADGSWMYIVNGKSDTGPNPTYGYDFGDTPPFSTITYPEGTAAHYSKLAATNQYQFQLERATLVSGAVPGTGDLPALTAQAALNNNYQPISNPNTAADAAVMAFARQHIQHVIYIVKENRTFDQLLGDLGNGSNGDPSLTLFGKRITPSFHRMSSQFVTLDNFMDPGDGSMDGWSWSLQGRTTNTETITQQLNYAFVDRGVSYDSEGSNRNVPVRLNRAGRDAASSPTGLFTTYGNAQPGGANNLLAGTGDHSATDAPFGVQLGYIFDAVLQAGGTVRNYGFLVNNIGAIKDSAGNAITSPFATGVVQTYPLNPSLSDKTDTYFRGFDQAYPDFYRFNEWNREFQGYVANNNLPSLEMVRMSHDHTGSFGSALAGVNTPETQEADNDYSVGRIVQAVSQSRYAANTLFIITEDDSQDGADHFDSHRATAYVVGPYVKQGSVVSTRYNQVSALRTIEDILGTQHLNLNTAYQRPMADVFDVNSTGAWSFTAVASRILATTTLQFADAGGKSDVQFADGADIKPTHDSHYWAYMTRGFDFSDADRVPPGLYNEVLWNGINEGVPYPTHPNGLVLGRRDKAAN